MIIFLKNLSAKINDIVLSLYKYGKNYLKKIIKMLYFL